MRHRIRVPTRPGAPTAGASQAARAALSSSTAGPSASRELRASYGGRKEARKRQGRGRKEARRRLQLEAATSARCTDVGRTGHAPYLRHILGVRRVVGWASSMHHRVIVSLSHLLPLVSTSRIACYSFCNSNPKFATFLGF